MLNEEVSWHRSSMKEPFKMQAITCRIDKSTSNLCRQDLACHQDQVITRLNTREEYTVLVTYIVRVQYLYINYRFVRQQI